MAPIRRYLRITKYSVLEVRIYLDNPSQQPWLLNPRDNVLPRIFKAIKPYVLPKLREENERAKGKGKRLKGVKDTVTEDDFEVSIFLTEVSTRHALLTKQKNFQDKKSRIQSNSGKLTGWLEGGSGDEPVTVREESDDEAGPSLQDSPVAGAGAVTTTDRPSNGAGRTVDDDISDDEGFQFQAHKRSARGQAIDLEAGVGEPGTDGQDNEIGDDDDKKKLSMDTAYEGFSIYGRILCLVIKRKSGKGKISGLADQAGQMMLENWVSTQAEQLPIMEE